jgi:aryl-phospho-beta-D-glucosidase BglC (GH1 family)
MGGQECNDCSACRQSEWSLATYLGREKTNEVFKQRWYHFSAGFHLLMNITRTADWESWLTQDDVDGMVAAGLNTVRIPLGFWIIEDIVDESHEPYVVYLSFILEINER